ncbi:MAG: hypothetical protein HYS98_07750 [Deltaproteobacteria bacterium]|nr:hypothetical protein [Deltaproteobacteria bacterium]
MKKRFIILCSLITIVLSAFIFRAISRPDNPYHGVEGQKFAMVLSKDIMKIIQNNSLSSESKASELAKIGQFLLEEPMGAHHALKVFQKSYEYDSKNINSNFFLSVLEPVHALRGAIYRFHKIFEIDPEEYFQNIQDKNNISNQNVINRLKYYILGEMKKDLIFELVSDSQDFIVKQLLPVLTEAEKKIEFVESSANFEIAFSYQHWQNAWSPKSSVLFDLGEVHAYHSALKAAQALLKFASAYNLNDAQLLDKAFKAEKKLKDPKKLTLEDEVKIIKAFPQFLTLRKEYEGNIKTILEDAPRIIEGLRILAQFLKEAKDRELYLVPQMDEETFTNLIESLEKADEYIAGPLMQKIGVNETSKEPITILANFTALLTQPPLDFKSILPAKFSEQTHNAIEWADTSFGGVFPNNDFISTLCQLKKANRTIKIEGMCPDDRNSE